MKYKKIYSDNLNILDCTLRDGVIAIIGTLILILLENI